MPVWFPRQPHAGWSEKTCGWAESLSLDGPPSSKTSNELSLNWNRTKTTWNKSVLQIKHDAMTLEWKWSCAGVLEDIFHSGEAKIKKDLEYGQSAWGLFT